MPTKAFQFKLSELIDTGTFEGIASTYGDPPDLGGDVIEPGAFTKSLADAGTRRPLLWQHRDPVGVVDLTDSPDGLLASGQLTMAVRQAQEAFALLKDGAVNGLSIGFEPVRSKFVGDTRHLTEIRLWELSIVTFPMNQQATITSVKAAQQAAQKAELLRAIRAFRNEVKNLR